MNIDIDDVNKVNLCKTLYHKVLDCLFNNYSKDNLDYRYEEDSNGELMEYHIGFLPREYNCAQAKIVTVIVLILFAVANLNILKIM